MSAETKFQKALMLLDRGLLERGEAVLREALVGFREQNDERGLLQTSSCLGDLLVELGRGEEARQFLEPVAAATDDTGVLAEEIRRSQELLASLGEVSE